MLYDPKWKRETVDDFIAWLETLPPEQTYDFYNRACCPVARWQSPRTIEEWPQEIVDIYRGIDPGRIAGGSPRTYGAALARARAVVV